MPQIIIGEDGSQSTQNIPTLSLTVLYYRIIV